MAKTKQQFQAQFETRLNIEPVAHHLQFDRIVCETPLFRLLEKLVITRDDGSYWMHA